MAQSIREKKPYIIPPKLDCGGSSAEYIAQILCISLRASCHNDGGRQARSAYDASQALEQAFNYPPASALGKTSFLLLGSISTALGCEIMFSLLLDECMPVEKQTEH